MTKTKISIIMGVYNCETTISQSIDSIINQTFKEWELIMCDDASTDNTYDIALKYTKLHDNIFLYKNDINLGLNKTLNKCLKYSKGDYIARMDGDDISLPNRLEEEYKFLESHPEYAIVSTPMIFFDEEGDFGFGRSSGEPSLIKVMKGTPFCHAPSMVRKEAYDKVNGYSESIKTMRVEDYDLWVRMMAAGYKGYNLPTPLYKVKEDRNAYSRRKYKYRINEAYVKFRAFKLLHPPISSFIFIFKPLIIGIIPKFLYVIFHRNRILKNTQFEDLE